MVISEAHQTAYHEAGHAVAAVLQGISVRYVTLRPRTKIPLDVPNIRVGGLTSIRPGRYSAWDLAVELHAGPIAGARIVWIMEQRDVLDEEYQLGGLGDAVRLSELVADDDDPDGFWDESLQEAHNLLFRRWDLVEKVATALMDRKTVTGAEIQAMRWGMAS
jgi:ATP-dependent Zn protease